MNAAPNASPNLDLVLDVPVNLSVQLGGCRLPMGRVLQLAPGSVVALDQPVSQPVELLVNGKLVARGEVVVMDDRFGVKITELARA